MQDVHGIAIRKLLGAKWPILGHTVGFYYERLERRLLKSSDHVILISDRHRCVAEKYGVQKEKLSVLTNWAFIEEFPTMPKVNQWSISNDVAHTFNFVYSGTLGMKHTPELLLKLARELWGLQDVRVIVVSEGPGAEWLDLQKRQLGLENLIILPFQPLELLGAALACADVLLVLLSRGASEFSVPSKVLTYLCIGRPLLMAIPAENTAAHLVNELDAGIVIPPEFPSEFIRAAQELFSNSYRREAMGKRARMYAEYEFRTERICDKFLSVLQTVLEQAKHKHLTRTEARTLS
jgi:glycosyltransferase involved in cell wall biosynthesis